MFDMNAVDADEHLVYKDFADAFDSGWTNEGKPVSTQEPAGNDDLQIVAMTQLHSYVHRIRQNGDAFVQANAASDLSGGRAGADSEYVAVTDQFSRNETDAAFFSTALSFLFVIVGDVTEWFVKEWLNGNGAAVAATQESVLLEFSEIAADGRRRHLVVFGQRGHRDLTGTQQFLQNHLSASLGRRGIFAHLFSLQCNSSTDYTDCFKKSA